MTLPTYNPDEIMDALQGADYEFVLENAMSHAVAGNSDAQCTIALLYEGGLGVRRDFVEAERWLLKAAAQNNALAWHSLGTLYAVKHPCLEHRWSEARAC
jgi:TPR repeat protein